MIIKKHPTHFKKQGVKTKISFELKQQLYIYAVKTLIEFKERKSLSADMKIVFLKS